VWLTVGGVLIVLLLLTGALLPRPNPENPLVDIPGIGSRDRDASRWAMKGGNPGKGEGARLGERRPGEQPQQQDGSKDGRGGKGERGGDKPGDTGSKGQQGGKDKSDGGNQPGGQKGNTRQGGDKGQSSGDKSGNGNDRAESSGKDRSGQRRDPDSKQGEATGNKQKQPPEQGKKQEPGSQEKGEQSQGEGQSQPPPSGSLLQSLQSFLAGLLPLLKWIVLIVFVLVVGFLLLRALLQFLANFSTWAAGLLKALRDLWQALFGWLQPRPATSGGSGGEEQGVGGPPPRPFSWYANPFTDGRARRLSPEELVRYSFEALQAWAWERDLGRRPDETPLEFVARLGDEVPALEADAVRLANLYVRALYGRGSLPASCRGVVEQFWRTLDVTAGQSVSV
jgi:hypothetical protein